MTFELVAQFEQQGAFPGHSVNLAVVYDDRLKALRYEVGRRILGFIRICEFLTRFRGFAAPKIIFVT